MNIKDIKEIQNALKADYDIKLAKIEQLEKELMVENAVLRGMKSAMNIVDTLISHWKDQDMSPREAIDFLLKSGPKNETEIYLSNLKERRDAIKEYADVLTDMQKDQLDDQTYPYSYRMTYRGPGNPVTLFPDK